MESRLFESNVFAHQIIEYKSADDSDECRNQFAPPCSKKLKAVMKAGKIVEMGSYGDLISKKGMLYELEYGKK